LEPQASRPTDDRTVIAVSSFALALALVLVLCTPFVEMTGILSEEQKAYRLYGYATLGLIEAALIPMRGWRRSLRIFSSPVSLVLIWSAFSLTWTQHVDLTTKRLVLLALVYGGVFGSVSDLDVRRSLGIVRIALVVALVMNFAVAIADPDVGMQPFGGSHLWRGIMGHKNIAGMLCSVTIILFTFDCAKVPVLARTAAIGAALVFFFLAWSKTTLASLPLASGAAGAVILAARQYPALSERWRRSAGLVALGLFGLIVVILLVATVQQNFLLSLTDDTGKLTGRTAIWRPMIQFYLEHAFLGAGYGAYWNPNVDLIDAAAGGRWANVDQGHNGYLDLLTQIGLPGLTLALCAAFVWPVRPIFDMIGKSPQRAALIVALLVFFLIENFSESSLFADDTLGNGFLLLALACVQRFGLRSAERSKSGSGEMISAARRRERRQRQQRSDSKT
jgi:O-antigen ligase